MSLSLGAKPSDILVSFQNTGASAAVAFGDELKSNTFESLSKPSAGENKEFWQLVSLIRQTYDHCRALRGDDPQTHGLRWPLGDSPPAADFAGLWLPYIPSRLLASENLPTSTLLEATLNDLAGPNWKVRRLQSVPSKPLPSGGTCW